MGFPEEETPLHLTLVLAGITVLVEEASQSYDAAYRELQRCSVSASWHTRGGLSFPIRDLSKLASSTAHITCDEGIAGMWEFLVDPSADELPATMHARGNGASLQWVDAHGVSRIATIPDAAIPALLASGIPFVAEPGAWRVIEQNATVPVVAGRVALNADGFLEIHTSTPQLVEASPLPALFRLDDTHYGMPAALAPALEQASGFVWDSDHPALPRRVQVPEHLDVTDHVYRHAAALASQLDAYKAAAVVWSPGLGRRVAVLAALEALDAWPALVVCPPHAIWLWQRHVDMIGREVSLSHNDADVRIVTYNDLRYIALEDPTAIVFDDPYSHEALSNSDACHRLDALRDTYRISVSSTWSDDHQRALRVLSLLRPSEFRPDVPVVWRYPTRPEARLAQHAAAYLIELSTDEVPPAATSRFRRSSVAVCEPTTEQLAALAEYQEMFESGEEDPDVLLALARELVTAGTSTSPSPKLAEVVSRVRTATNKGRSVAVVVSSQKAASRLRMLLRPSTVHLVDEVDNATPKSVPGEVTIVRATSMIPSLLQFDEVVVCEYPPSLLALDRAIGASHSEGPLKVTLVHLARSIDDRLAVSASLAREQGVASPAEHPETLLVQRH